MRRFRVVLRPNVPAMAGNVPQFYQGMRQGKQDCAYELTTLLTEYARK